MVKFKVISSQYESVFFRCVQLLRRMSMNCYVGWSVHCPSVSPSGRKKTNDTVNISFNIEQNETKHGVGVNMHKG